MENLSDSLNWHRLNTFSDRHALARAIRQCLARRGGSLACLIGLGAMTGATGLQAANLVVANTSSDGSGSLRAAIAQANSLSGPDNITFNPSVQGTIDLSAGTLEITDSVSLSGPGSSRITLQGDGSSAVIQVIADDESEDLAVTVSGVTIQGGGTGIIGTTTFYSNASVSLNISATTITGNSGGIGVGPGGYWSNVGLRVADSVIMGNGRGGIGVASGGRFGGGASATIERSSIVNNGGSGISANGVRINVAASTVSNNLTGLVGSGYWDYITSGFSVSDSVISANFREGIKADSTWLQITRSTIDNNGGTGISIGLFGDTTLEASTVSRNGAGGIVVTDSYSTEVYLSNSTISGNRNGFGLSIPDGRWGGSLDHVTIADNAAGGIDIGSYGLLPISNSIIAGNGESTGSDLSTDTFDPGGYGPGFQLAYSLIQDAGGAPVDEVVAGSNLLGANPRLRPLARNGGPTATHALRPASPAINAGDPAFSPPPAFDQRGAGFARVSGGRLDMGAFERQAALAPAGSVTVNHLWTALCPSQLPAVSVVFLGVPTYNGKHPGVARMRSVSGSPCAREVRFQEWDYRIRDFNDYVHGDEQVGFLGLTPGRYNMPDGSTWEVGLAEARGTGAWRRYRFGSALPGRPSLFLSPQTAKGDSAVVIRARGVDQTGFEAALYEEEFLMDGHAAEQFGYLAIHHPAGGNVPNGVATLGGARTPYSLHRAGVDHQWTSVAGVELKMEEEKSRDSETIHARETVDVLTVAGQVFAQDVSSVGGDTAALRRR